jgi:hypothetical protein
MTGADREPLGTVIPNAGELAGGTAGGGQNVQGSHCLPPFALQLPGGRLVILSPDPAAPLLVAE